MNDKQKKPPKLLAEGRFRARCVSELMTETRNLAPQVALQIELLAGPNFGEKGVWFGGFHPNSEKYTIDALHVCGWQGDGFSPAALQACRTNEFDVSIVNEVGQDGVTRSNFKFISALGLGGMLRNRLSKQGIADLEKRFCGGQAADEDNDPFAPRPDPDGPGFDGDDINF